MENKDSSDFNATRAELFEAISHPARITILQTLSEKPMGFAELGRAVGIESGGHLQFHLNKLAHLVKTTPEGTYALTGDGKEALWSINALRKSRNGTTTKSREAPVIHRNWAKPVLGGLLIALIALGTFAALQQQQMGALDSNLAAQKDQIANQQSQIAKLHDQIANLHDQIAALGGNAQPFYNGMSASLAIGKPDFTTSVNPLTSSGLASPQSAAFDSSGNLWVADGNRILEFKAPFTNSMDASIVIGQRDFTASASATTRSGDNGPGGMTFDSSGNLWASDQANNRVLEFKAPFTNGMNASLVIGEPNFTSHGCGGYYYQGGPCIASKNALSRPQSVAFDSSGNLWVADADNSRVLEFTPPFTNGMDASIVIGVPDFTPGQPDFTAGGCFYSAPGCTVAQNTLAEPCAITFDFSGNLWVADCGSGRALEFRGPFSSGMDASLVIGEPNFTGSCVEGPVYVGESSLPCGPTQNQLSLIYPSGMDFDSSGNLWVADGYNNRVLEFKSPFSNGMNALLVIGQHDFTSRLGPTFCSCPTSKVPVTTQRGLASPAGVTIDPSGNLWVVDNANNRVLEFRAPFSNGMDASLVIGKSRFTTSLPATTQSQLSSPQGAGLDSFGNLGVALDSSGNLWVADEASNRVLEFKPPFSNGMYASLVIGQPDFASSESATIQSRLSSPSVLGFDSSGNLWVAGSDGISEFRPPFSNGMDASLAMGQSVLTSSVLNPSLRNGTWAFGSPGGMAFDSSGNLWIKQNGFNYSGVSRVLEFRAPFSNGMNASLVIGKSSFALRGTGGGDGNGPYGGIAFDSSGNLWVADTQCCSFHPSRLLEFQAPFTTDMAASLVIEPGVFTSKPNPTTLIERPYPTISNGIGFDPSGNLWVADGYNSRVLELKAPFTNGMNASVVIGQDNFTSYASTTTQAGLASPAGIGFDSSGNLWVADSGNGRVLRFDPTTTSGTMTTVTIGASSEITSGSVATGTVPSFQDPTLSLFVAAVVIAAVTLVAFGFLNRKKTGGVSG